MITRTSITDPIRVDWLPRSNVGLTFAPGKKGRSVHGDFWWARDLGADLDRLQRVYRVGLLVCLLEDHDLARLGIRGLFGQARRRGLQVEHLPVRDLSVPRSERVDAATAAGVRAVIHCAGGLGRAGTIAGCYLVNQGLPPAHALKTLRRVRGPDCPETLAQAAYIYQWAMAPMNERP